MKEESEIIENYENDSTLTIGIINLGLITNDTNVVTGLQNLNPPIANTNPVTPANNAVAKSPIKNWVTKISGSSENKAGEWAEYKIESFNLSDDKTTNNHRNRVKWCIWYEGDTQVDLPKSCISKLDKEKPLVLEKKRDYHNIYTALDSCPEDGILKIKFSKWLDTKKVKVEAFMNKAGDKNCQVETEITAPPEIITGYWANAKGEEIKEAGYQQEVFICLETLGMQGANVSFDIFEFDEGLANLKYFVGDGSVQIEFEENSVVVSDYKTMLKFKIKKEDDESYDKAQSTGDSIWLYENKMELYFVANPDISVRNLKSKYGFYLELHTTEKIMDAYFAKKIIKEIDKATGVSVQNDSSPAPSQEKIHTVVKNENGTVIAGKYAGISWPNIAAHNSIKQNAILKINQKLNIPNTSDGGTNKGSEQEGSNKEKIEVYERINKTSIGKKVFLVVEALNLAGKQAKVRIFEKEVVLVEKETPLLTTDVNKENSSNEICVDIDDTGKGIVEITLHPGNDEEYEKWAEKLKPIPENCYEDIQECQKNDMFEDDSRYTNNPDGYTLIERIGEKEMKDYLWLEVKCKGDDKKHKGDFLKDAELELECKKICECEAKVRAFLRTIRVKEGVVGEIGYETLVGGKSFIKDYNKGWGDHPNVMVYIKRLNVNSSAAGAYQVMGYTWKGQKSRRTKYNIADFSPISQDKFGVLLLKYKRRGKLSEAVITKYGEKFRNAHGDLIQMILDDDFNKLILTASLEWASFPDSPYGQQDSSYTAADVKKIYDNYLKDELKGESDLYLKPGFLKEFGYGCCGDSLNNSDDKILKNGVKLHFIGSSSKENSLSIKTKNILKEVGKKTGNMNIYITSTARTPKEQADIMYRNCERTGAATQKGIYANSGDKVIDVYSTEKTAGSDKATIVSKMEAKIKALGPSTISKHIADFSVMNTFDVSDRRLTNKQKFWDEMEKHKDLDEILTENNCYHIQIKQ